jgi:NADH dehydrogenase
MFEPERGLSMKKLVIVGGGFAGVWAALQASAVRHRANATRRFSITLVSRDPWLTIRPRLYEDSLDGVRVPLAEVLDPQGVELVEAEVRHIDTESRLITLGDGTHRERYDKLVFAAGSLVQRAAIPGAEKAFAVDTYKEAAALRAHLETLPRADEDTAGRYTAVVIGAGFTGIEVATTLVSRLRRIAAVADAQPSARVVLVERSPLVVPDLGPSARREVMRALAELGIECHTGIGASAIDDDGVRLADGRRIPAATVVITGGFRANPLAAQLPVPHDAIGRVDVDRLLRVRGAEHVYAAGDVARAKADMEGHVVPMSCQCAIPMGEIAGANAAAALLGLRQAEFTYPDYVTCLDLGEAGALFMEGWDREVRLTGHWGKVMKESINTRLIYPPRRGHASRRDGIAAVA